MTIRMIGMIVMESRRPVRAAWSMTTAASVASVAERAYAGGLVGTDRSMAVHYLRLSQAERERLEKEKNQNHQS